MVAASIMQPATARNPMGGVVVFSHDFFIADIPALLPLSHL